MDKNIVNVLREQAKALQLQADALNSLAAFIEKDTFDTTKITGTALKSNSSELPLGLSVKDVSKHLGISLSKASELVHSKGFPKIHIGRRYIIPRDQFLLWISSNSV